MDEGEDKSEGWEEGDIKADDEDEMMDGVLHASGTDPRPKVEI